MRRKNGTSRPEKRGVSRVRPARRLENDERFLDRVGRARRSLRAGRGVKLGDVK